MDTDRRSLGRGRSLVAMQSEATRLQTANHTTRASGVPIPTLGSGSALTKIVRDWLSAFGTPAPTHFAHSHT